jgi:hypothetical protein
VGNAFGAGVLGQAKGSGELGEEAGERNDWGSDKSWRRAGVRAVGNPDDWGSIKLNDWAV